jgi:hypothetical protein
MCVKNVINLIFFQGWPLDLKTFDLNIQDLRNGMVALDNGKIKLN